MLAGAAVVADAGALTPAIIAGIVGAGLLGDGVLALLAEWSTYALVVIAVIGLGFQQASLKVGVLPPAMATVNVANLVTSVVLGVGIFSETLSHGHGTLAFAVIGLVVTILGVLDLMGIPVRRRMLLKV